MGQKDVFVKSYFSRIIHSLAPVHFAANCITENVTLRSNVASGKMLLTDGSKSLSEEQHDEPEKQA